MKKTSKKVIAVTLSASMLLGGSMTAMAATTNPDISQREIDHKTAAKNIAAQGMVLMENKNNSLPISVKKGTKVALFGQGVFAKMLMDEGVRVLDAGELPKIILKNEDGKCQSN